jgi:peptidoglycan/LPS O-acetylase OafA/YrhL
LSKVEQNRLGFIEGLRGLAALYVVFQHIGTMVDPHFKMLRPGAQPEYLARIMAPFWYGHFAVSAFIVISGFCLQMALYHRGDGQLLDLKKFLVRRMRRILPPYYACLALSLVVCFSVTQHQKGLPWAHYLPVTNENIAAHVFMVHNLSKDWMYKINGVLWSIAIEFQLYFLFPAFCAVIWKRGALPVLALAGVFCAGVMLAFPASEKLYPWYGVLFILGMAAARWAMDPRLKRLPVSALTGVFVLFFSLALASIGWTKELVWRDGLMGIAVSALLMAGLQSPESRWCKIIGAKPLMVLGTFSYSLYLMHHPILQVIYANRPAVASTMVRQYAFLIACLPLVAGLCYAFFWVFERPFMGAKKVASREGEP